MIRKIYSALICILFHIFVVKESHNNYTPSWMRQTRSPSVPSSGVLGPAKSLPSLSNSNEVPAWKRELAQRRQNRKEKTPEVLCLFVYLWFLHQFQHLFW